MDIRVFTKTLFVATQFSWYLFQTSQFPNTGRYVPLSALGEHYFLFGIAMNLRNVYQPPEWSNESIDYRIHNFQSTTTIYRYFVNFVVERIFYSLLFEFKLCIALDATHGLAVHAWDRHNDITCGIIYFTDAITFCQILIMSLIIKISEFKW